MAPKVVRGFAVVYTGLALVAVTWPGILPFSAARPLVLGLPFSMAWIAGWVAGFTVVFAILDAVDRRALAADPRSPRGDE